MKHPVCNKVPNKKKNESHYVCLESVGIRIGKNAHVYCEVNSNKSQEFVWALFVHVGIWHA